MNEALTAVQQSTIALLQALPVPPRRVSVKAGEIEIDIDWDVATAVPQAQPAEPAAVPVEVEPPGTSHVCAPAVGTFYRSPEPGGKPFVEEGERVRAGQTVAIVEAMKLMLPVEAPTAGTISRILVADGDPVEFGQQLLAVCDD